MTDRSPSDERRPSDRTPPGERRQPIDPAVPADDTPDASRPGAARRDPADGQRGETEAAASGTSQRSAGEQGRAAGGETTVRRVRVDDSAPGSPARPRVQPPADRSWFWPLVNLIGLLVVVLVNILANVIPFNGQTTGEVINKDPVPFQPAGWVFSIWGLIYILLGVFAIYGLLPAGRHNARLQRLSPLFLVANLANIVWLVLWHWEFFAASLAVMAVLLASLLAIYVIERIRNPLRRAAAPPATSLRTRLERLVMWTPFSVYLGWICVAVLANLMVWLDRSGWDGGPFSYNVWAVLFIVGGTLVAALFAFLWHDPLVPLVFVWAYIGIMQRQWGEAALVSVVALIFALVAAALAVVASLLAFDRNVNLPRFSRSGPGAASPQAIRVTRSPAAPSGQQQDRPEPRDRTP